MSGWKIDVDGVRRVLVRVVHEGEALSLHERDALRLSDEARGVCRPSERLGVAVSEFLTAHGDDVRACAETSRRVLDAAAEATRAYVAGDEAMAVDTSASASAFSLPGAAGVGGW